MSIEEQVFKRSTVIFSKLIEYGFQKNEDTYVFNKVIIDGFKAIIEINDKGQVKGKIIDLNLEEEYVNFRIECLNGGFVNSVREAYISLLEDIKEHCFKKLFFISEQANRICEKIMEMYHCAPAFLWEKFKGYGVFRNLDNEKWFGIIMNINKGKLDKSSKEEIEIINVKVDDNIIEELLKQKGIYPSYHMNKKNWISIVLDDTLSDEEIIGYIQASYKYTKAANKK